MSKRAEEAERKYFGKLYQSQMRPERDAFINGYEQAEKETIQRIKELLKVRIVERTERCQEDWSNRQKDRVNIRNDEDGDIILVLEKLGGRIMDKATKVAVEKYPHGTFDGELGDFLRATCAVGYMQAEKDLALTWEDVKKIEDLCMEVATLFASVGRNKDILEPPFYEEILRRFNSQREKK